MRTTKKAQIQLLLALACALPVQEALSAPVVLTVVGELASKSESWLVGDVGAVYGTWRFSYDNAGSSFNLYEPGFLGDASRISRTYAFPEGAPPFATNFSNAAVEGPRLLDLVSIAPSVAVSFPQERSFDAAFFIGSSEWVSSLALLEGGDEVSFYQDVDGAGRPTASHMYVSKWIVQQVGQGSIGQYRSLDFRVLSYTFDSVGSVPEPGSLGLAMLGCGLLCVLAMTRKDASAAVGAAPSRRGAAVHRG